MRVDSFNRDAKILSPPRQQHNYAWCRGQRCTSPGDTAFQAAFADLPSNKGRLGGGFLCCACSTRCRELLKIKLYSCEHIYRWGFEAEGLGVLAIQQVADADESFFVVHVAERDSHRVGHDRVDEIVCGVIRIGGTPLTVRSSRSPIKM